MQWSLCYIAAIPVSCMTNYIYCIAANIILLLLYYICSVHVFKIALPRQSVYITTRLYHVKKGNHWTTTTKLLSRPLVGYVLGLYSCKVTKNAQAKERSKRSQGSTCCGGYGKGTSPFGEVGCFDPAELSPSYTPTMLTQAYQLQCTNDSQ